MSFCPDKVNWFHLSWENGFTVYSSFDGFPLKLKKKNGRALQYCQAQKYFWVLVNRLEDEV